jgi:hypothetical protein
MTDIDRAHAIACPGGFRPTPIQELLLKAALLEGDVALSAWREWKSAADIDRIDSGSYRLLPLLHANLRALGVEDPLMDRLKGIRQRTWYANQVLFRDLAALLRTFHGAGMETMVLKGAALATLHYLDVGLRPMTDFDILVRPSDAAEAIRMLTETGWIAKNRPPTTRLDRYCGYIHSIPFWRQDNVECDLHWHVLPECCNDGADDAFLRDAVPLRIHDVETRALSPTFQILHACIHGARWNEVPPLRWIVDTMMVLRSAGGAVDWELLFREAVEWRLVLPLREALGYFVSLLNAPIPADLLAHLARQPVSTLQRMEYRVRTSKPGLTGFLPEATLRHLTYSRRAWPMRIATLPRAYQYAWKVDQLRKVPYYAVMKSARRIVKAIRH